MSTRRLEVVVFSYILCFISLFRETCFYKCWQLGCTWVEIFCKYLVWDRRKKRNIGLKNKTKQNSNVHCRKGKNIPGHIFFFGHTEKHVGSQFPEQGLKMEPTPPALEARSLKHWTAREGLWSILCAGRLVMGKPTYMRAIWPSTSLSDQQIITDTLINRFS